MTSPTNRFKDELYRNKANKPKPKEVLTKVIAKLPSNPSDVPPEFFQLDPKEVFNQIAAEAIVDDEPNGYQVKSGADITRRPLEDLDRLKAKLGGAPNYAGGIVTLNNEDAKKNFMGQPLTAVKDWFRKTLQNKWVPKLFWKGLAKCFNVTDKITSYEQAHERIQRFGIVSANKEEIHGILDSGDPSRYIEFNRMTGLAWHPKDNSPGMEKFYIRMMDDFMTIYYEDAKARGDDALIEYYKAYDGVCFEDRMKIIEKYMATHPTLEMEAQAKVQPSDEIDPSQIAFYTAETDVNNVLYAECGELSARLTKKNGEETLPTSQELWDHLVAKGVAGREFPDPNGSGAKIKVTPEYLNNDEVRSNLIDIVMVLSDSPKIVKAIEMPKDMNNVADYDKDADIYKVLFEEIKELSSIINEKEKPKPGHERAPTPQELWDRLVEKGVAGKEFPKAKGSSDKVALTATYLNKDEVRGNLIDDCMVLDEGPKIVVKAEAAHEEPTVSASAENLDQTVMHRM